MELKYSKHNIQSLRKMFWQLPQNQENVIFEVDWDVKAKNRNFIFKIINEYNDTDIEIEKRWSQLEKQRNQPNGSHRIENEKNDS